MDDPRQVAQALAQTLRARALYHGPRRVAAPRERPVERPEAAQRGVSFHQLRDAALVCEQCRLCEGRNHVVFGEGSETAELMFIGEAPGFDEDRTGRPFVGKAGELLTRMIENGMGLRRDEVYIANVLKCRPPQNRDPSEDEVEACRPWLLQQIEHIQPKVICTLGRHALRALTGYEGGISRARGRAMPFAGCHVLPTFHPAYLLRNPNAKREAWEDLKTVLRMLGRPVPPPRR
ncbi:MAG: uracil-DNA glycosylase [Planctomycetota bacterium]